MIKFDTSANPLFSRQEVWFNTDPAPAADKSHNIFYQSLAKPTIPVADLEAFNTTLIRLAEGEDTLFERIRKNVRYEIQRAPKEGVFFQPIERPTAAEQQEYLQIQSAWAASKNRKGMARARFLALARTENVLLAKAAVPGQTLVFHLYLFDNQRARLLTSYHNVAYDDRNLIGYANKFLHWESIRHFKNRGLAEYDFGGIDEVNTPGIAQFKLSFGGEREQSWNFRIERGLYAFAKKLRGK